MNTKNELSKDYWNIKITLMKGFLSFFPFYTYISLLKENEKNYSLSSRYIKWVNNLFLLKRKDKKKTKIKIK